MPVSSAAQAESLRFDPDGAQRWSGAAGAETLRRLEDALREQPTGRAGVRLFGVAALRRLLEPSGTVGAVAASILGPRCRPVRAILFDKTPTANWALGWHQDRVIAVARRIEVEGFGPWTRKHGGLHVAPPFDVLARMLTLRIHLDDVPGTNAPLLVAPGSHRLGRIPEANVRDVVRRSGVASCTAVAGDIWLYATPILHASDAATDAGRRRVLQADYAADDLPGGLQWLGV